MSSHTAIKVGLTIHGHKAYDSTNSPNEEGRWKSGLAVFGSTQLLHFMVVSLAISCEQ